MSKSQKMRVAFGPTKRGFRHTTSIPACGWPPELAGEVAADEISSPRSRMAGLSHGAVVHGIPTVSPRPRMAGAARAVSCAGRIG